MPVGSLVWFGSFAGPERILPIRAIAAVGLGAIATVVLGAIVAAGPGAIVAVGPGGRPGFRHRRGPW